MSDSRDLWTCSPPGSSVHGISRHEFSSGLLFPSQEDLPDPRIEPMSPVATALQVFSSALSHQGSPEGEGREIFLVSAVSQLSSAQNNPSTKVAYFEVANFDPQVGLRKHHYKQS